MVVYEQFPTMSHDIEGNGRSTANTGATARNRARAQVIEALSTFSLASRSATGTASQDQTPNLRAATDWADITTLTPSQSANIDALSDRLSAIPGVSGVIPDFKTQGFLVANDQYTNLQWHYYDPVGGINLEEAWEVALDGNFATTLPEVTVAVIDSGILPHEDLAGQVLPGADFISALEISRDGDGRDTDPTDPGDYTPAGACAPGIPAEDIASTWHGTVISGLIAASVNNAIGVAGVAPNAKVVPIRVLGRCGGSLLDALEGMVWAAGGSVAGLPNNPNPAAVINMSFGVEGAVCTPEIQGFVDTVAGLGSVLVAATGNSAINTADVIPASCNNVIAIGAASSTGNAANYSNLGAAVDLLAPGANPTNPADPDVGILSTSNNGAEGPNADDYIRGYAGTSMAAPHVSGVVAMMLGLDPTLSPTQIEQILKDTARPFPAACNGCGAGRLDAKAAVQEAQGAGLTHLMGLLLMGLLLRRSTKNLKRPTH
jgi:serine protease